MNLISEAGSAHKVITEESRKLAGKWEKSGLLEGLKSYDKQAMAVMLENQASQLLQENSYTNQAGTAGEQWAGVALPLVRKVFGSIASKNFVSVQPMNLPSGLVFYMDFKYGTTRNGQTSGTSVYGDNLGSPFSTFGNTNTGGLYGAGRFAYTVNDQTLTGLTAAPASASFSDVNFNDEFVATGSLSKYTVATSSFTRGDFLAVRSFVPSGSIVDFGALVLPEFTKVVGANVVFIVNTAVAAGKTLNSVIYSQQPTDTTRGDFEDTTGSGDIGIPEMNLELRSETIVAKTRKLKAVWSPELAQDLNAYHSVDAWTNMTWYQTLGQKMQKVSNKIHQLTMRGGANFAVVSPTVATILETIPGFMAGTDGDKMEFAGGVTKVGSFQNRYTIYKNPYMKENIVLLGFRGSNFLETGAVYAPYIPLIMTPLVYDPTNFTPRRGVMTRYAKKVVRPEFFGKIVIDGLANV